MKGTCFQFFSKTEQESCSKILAKPVCMHQRPYHFSECYFLLLSIKYHFYNEFSMANLVAESIWDMLIVVVAVLLSVLLGALLVIPQSKKTGNFSLSWFSVYSTNYLFHLQGCYFILMQVIRKLLRKVLRVRYTS